MEIAAFLGIFEVNDIFRKRTCRKVDRPISISLMRHGVRCFRNSPCLIGILPPLASVRAGQGFAVVVDRAAACDGIPAGLGDHAELTPGFADFNRDDVAHLRNLRLQTSNNQGYTVGPAPGMPNSTPGTWRNPLRFQ
jgi:hypothetical protein